MRMSLRLAGMVGLVILAAWAPIQAADAPPSTRIVLTLTDNTKVQGILLRADENSVVVKVPAGEQTYTADKLTPFSMVMARRQVMDLTRAASHIELGKFLQANGLNAEAKREFQTAINIDPNQADPLKDLLAACAAPAKVADAGKATTSAAPTTRPAGSPASTGKPDPKTSGFAPSEQLAPVSDEQPKEIQKFQAVTPEHAAACIAKAKDWGEQCKKFAPSMHTVETDHYLIFSAWEPSNDEALKEIVERLYKALCAQFDIPPTQNIWAGKCGIYVFWEKTQFERFGSDVTGRGVPGAAGYCGSDSTGFCYVVLGPARSKSWFFEMLTHESTHAFISRYLTNRQIPTWTNEGTADYMAATLVPGAWAGRKYLNATRDAVRHGKEAEVAHVLQSVGLNEFDYGIAQSFVRFMIARDPKGYVKFVTEIKEGKTELEAMKDAFGFDTMDEFLKAWAAASVKAVGKM